MRLPGGRCCSGGELAALGEDGVFARRAAQVAADSRAFLVEEGFGSNVDIVERLQEARALARAAQQGTHTKPETARVVEHCARALDLGPFRFAKVGRENGHDDFAVVDAFFERQDEVSAPFDGLFVEKAFDAVAGEAAIQLFDEGLVLAAVAEENFFHFGFPLILAGIVRCC